MLVVLSDLHLIDGTAGKHNVDTEVFKDVFLTWIPALLEKKKSTKLKVLLLGDIVDLIRTEQWLEADAAERPWGDDGMADVNNAIHGAADSPGSDPPAARSTTEKRCLSILGELAHIDEQGDYRNTIFSRNRDIFKTFRDVIPAEMKRAGIEFEVHYVPGNHDRLCNLYPRVRDSLKTALGLSVDSEDGNWWYSHYFEDEDYGVFARHGHEHDVWNYGNANNDVQLTDYTRPGQLQVSIGDVIATEFAVKLPWVARQMQGDDDFVARLREIDNVRPIGNVIEWLLYRVQNERDDATRKTLEQTIEQVLDELFQIPLVEQWANPQTHKDEVVRAIGGPLRFLLHIHGRRNPFRSLENKLLSSLYRTYRTWAPRFADPDKDKHIEAAHKESVWQPGRNIRYLLYGHTHDPLIQPLRSSDGNEEVYINTGTWRERIVKTAGFESLTPQFVPLNQVTYVVFYDAQEEAVPSFDMWTGSSQAKGYR